MLDDPRLDEDSGVLNGLALVEDLRSLARRQRAVDLVLCDIDDLTRINAARGRGAGDELIRRTASALHALDPASYRFGGDEFALLSDPGRGPALAERVLRGCRDAFAGLGFAATCTVGFGAGPRDFSPATLLWTAESAVRAGKDAGGDRVSPPPDRLDGAALGGPLMDHFLRRLDETFAALRVWRDAALTDPVTGLPNHRYVREALTSALRQAAVAGEPMAVVFIDGDDLRRLNALSYEAGNAVIARLGKLLADERRPGDTLGRWFSGDEFLLVLPRTGAPEASAAAEALLAQVRRQSASWPIPVSVSVGIAVYPDHGTDEDALLTAAYAACATAKRAGKDRSALA